MNPQQRGCGRHLVEVEGVDVNSRDRWDSVPLYYACACGARSRPLCPRSQLWVCMMQACT